MRGILSLLLSGEPRMDRFRTGLIILSCSEDYEERIAQRVVEWMPHVRWAIVKRFEPALPWFEGPTIFSSQSATFSRQVRQILSIRRKEFDVVAVACTNEPSYMPLKILAVVSGYRSFVVFNENIDAYFLHRGTRRLLLNHWRWRLRERRYLHGRHRLAELLSWIFLFPPAALYLLVKVSFFVLRKRLRSGTQP